MQPWDEGVLEVSCMTTLNVVLRLNGSPGSGSGSGWGSGWRQTGAAHD